MSEIILTVKNTNAGSLAGTVEFNIAVQQFPPLLRDSDGGLILPHRYCGLRIIGGREFFWLDVSGQRVDAENHGDIKDLDEPEFYFGGVQFSGPLTTCASLGGPGGAQWRIPIPLSHGGTGPGPESSQLVVGFDQSTRCLFIDDESRVLGIPELYRKDLLPNAADLVRDFAERFPEDFEEQREAICSWIPELELCEGAGEQRTREYVFPSRREDLGEGDYWVISEFSEGETTLDIHVERWDDAAERWSRRRRGISQADYDADPTNDKHLAFGLPAYAPADGVVKTSWRDFPDNPIPGEKLPAVTGDNGEEVTIFPSGNHVTIETDDGRIFLIAHLRQGSVPDTLRPPTSQQFSMEKLGDYRRISFIPPADRPRVRAGDFLGRVGNSGNSSGPHIHITTAVATSDTTKGAREPIAVRGSWRQPYVVPATVPIEKERLSTTPPSQSAWTRFAGTGITKSVGRQVILPGFLRRAHETGHEMHHACLHFVRSRRLVAAMIGGSGDLQLGVWGMTPDGAFVARGEATSHRATQVAIVEPRSDMVVTTARDGQGALRLSSWRVDNDGQLRLLDTANAGSISRVAACVPSAGFIITAVRDSQEHLKLIAWHMSVDGVLTRRGDAQAGTVDDIAVARAQSADGVVTAVRDGSGELLITAWSVSSNGNTLTQRASAHAGAVDIVDLIPRGIGDRFMLSAVRDSAYRLRLITWRIDANGNSIERGATSSAGGVGELKLAGGHQRMHAVVACRDADGHLRLTSWRLSPDGKSLQRWGGARGEAATRIDIATTHDDGRDYYVTSCATSGKLLRIIGWEADL